MFSLKNIQHFHLFRHLGYNFYDGNDLNICLSHIGLSPPGCTLPQEKTQHNNHRKGENHPSKEPEQRAAARMVPQC